VLSGPALMIMLTAMDFVTGVSQRAGPVLRCERSPRNIGASSPNREWPAFQNPEYLWPVVFVYRRSEPYVEILPIIGVLLPFASVGTAKSAANAVPPTLIAAAPATAGAHS